MINTDSTLHAIVGHCGRLGAVASVEYPAHVRLVDSVDEGSGLAHIGTANGHWQADVFTSEGEANGTPAYTLDVPSAYQHPEGIARFVLGSLRHNYALLACPTAAEQRKADSDERGARGR